MHAFFAQIFNILTTNPGILVYHSVLAFSIAAILPISVYQWRLSANPIGRRMVIGLSLLLLTRLMLFIVSGLASQGLLGEIQPALDRAAALAGIILIVWLWVFPEPARMGDAAASLLGLLTLVVSILGLVWWSSQGANIPFNGSWPDIIAEIFALALLGIGLLVLILRRPIGWGNGLAMILVLLLGHSANLLFPLTNQDYQGAIRLAEMIAFPVLLTLTQRFSLPEAASKPGAGTAAFPLLYQSEPKTLQSLLSIATSSLPESIISELARFLASQFQADLCLIVSPDPGKERLNLHGGYLISRQISLEPHLLEGGLPATLAGNIRRGKSFRLPANKTPGLSEFCQSLGAESAGDLLAVPAGSAENANAFGIVLLSPTSSTAWTSEDQANLAGLSELLARILQHILAIQMIQTEAAGWREKIVLVGATSEKIQKENEELLAQLETTRQRSVQEHSRAESLAALIASQEESQETIARLEAEVKGLRTAASQAEASPPAEVKRLQGELNTALDEVALLKARLVEFATGAQTTEMATDRSNPTIVSSEQAEVVSSIAQELRQPMSSIVGYTDLLLGESVGILGALQRKFLERVRVSTQRMGGLLDDLIQTTSTGKEEKKLKPEAVDLNGVIDEAIAMTIGQIREKSIALRVDIPEDLPSLTADRDALQQILIHLLQNATAASPADSEISLSAITQTGASGTESDQDVVLIRVSDTGGGIPPDDLPRVFSRLYRADNALIQGVGDTGVGLSIVKTLVGAHGGRVWVDTEIGRGSTFSIILPISSSNLQTAAQKGTAG